MKPLGVEGIPGHYLCEYVVGDVTQDEWDTCGEPAYVEIEHIVMPEGVPVTFRYCLEHAPGDG